MIRKRKLLCLAITLLCVFLLTTYHILSTLDKAVIKSVKISDENSVEEKILQHLKNLPSQYFVQQNARDKTLEYVKNTQSLTNYSITGLWLAADNWITNSQITNFKSNNLGNILNALRNSKIIKADLDTRGTQLKLLLTLEGNQKVVFKPKWYEIDKIIEGPVYAGKDRYNSEIIAFYLSILLNKPFVPVIAARDISLSNDIVKVATKRLLDTSFVVKNKTCIYGKCLYCKKEDAICENENHILTGTVIYNIERTLKNHRSPWQRTYKKNKKAGWEENVNYCNIVKNKLSHNRINDLIDISVFDFLIQNGDRHHYETLEDMVLWLDNGKGLGNPDVHHLDILAPLYQCCRIRKTTWKSLLHLSGVRLKELMEAFPDIYQFITEDNLNAMQKRLYMVFAAIEYCRKNNKFVVF